MTARGSIVLFFLGIVIWIVGATMKIQHWPLANALMSVGSVIQSVAIIILAIKVWRYPGARGWIGDRYWIREGLVWHAF